MNGIEEAIKQAGGVRELSRKLKKDLGVTASRGTVSNWNQSGVVSAKFVIAVEKLTGVPCFKLNPKLYPPERFNPNVNKDDNRVS